MNRNKQILLLLGSAKHTHSTSESLGTYLLEKLNKRGMTTQTLFVHKLMKSGNRQETLISSIYKADVVVLAFPLYVDSPPYLVTKLMELIAQTQPSSRVVERQSLVCIINCGLPEVDHNATAMSICRKFADETGFRWDGGLALGGGEAINGKKLSSVKGMAHNIIKSLDLTAEALADGKPVPQKAVNLMSRPISPRWLYTFFGAIRFLLGAKRNGALLSLRARPFRK